MSWIVDCAIKHGEFDHRLNTHKWSYAKTDHNSKFRIYVCDICGKAIHLRKDKLFNDFRIYCFDSFLYMTCAQVIMKKACE